MHYLYQTFTRRYVQTELVAYRHESELHATPAAALLVAVAVASEPRYMHARQ